ncbi:MAG: nitric oxide reductase transcription regulator, partial [Burkholderiaceae bacterium]|nr:nitric oxide reductase transcription regulator [Burkholderiaceae bacterium]
IPIPPLRERGNDVLLLAGRFLELNRARLGLRSLRLSPEAESALRHYGWPGNVRELEHVISRAALKAMSRGASRNDIVTLEAALLDLEQRNLPAPHSERPAMAETAAVPAPISLRQAVDDYQRELIQGVLTGNDGNWARSAQQLELDASNLHKLARRLGIKG